MDNTPAPPSKFGLKSLATAFSLFGVVLVLAAWGNISGWGKQDKPLPQQTPEAVVGQFYEYISESKIRGGTLLVREAFKLTSGKQTRYGQAKFLEVINRYPAGFNATIIKSDIQGQHAEVTIEYDMASAFGGAYKVDAVIPLIVDDEANAWKIDFRGDTDDQDLAMIKKEYGAKDSAQTASRDVAK